MHTLLAFTLAAIGQSVALEPRDLIGTWQAQRELTMLQLHSDFTYDRYFADVLIRVAGRSAGRTRFNFFIPKRESAELQTHITSLALDRKLYTCTGQKARQMPGSRETTVDIFRDCHGSESNQSMKPTALWQNNLSVFATTPCRGLSLSR